MLIAALVCDRGTLRFLARFAGVRMGHGLSPDRGAAAQGPGPPSAITTILPIAFPIGCVLLEPNLQTSPDMMTSSPFSHTPFLPLARRHRVMRDNPLDLRTLPIWTQEKHRSMKFVIDVVKEDG